MSTDERPIYPKDPDDVLDYGWDWRDWLSENEVIVTSTMIASPGITVDSSTNSEFATVAWLSGGTAGRPYELTNRIFTNQGRTTDRTMTIRVTPR